MSDPASQPSLLPSVQSQQASSSLASTSSHTLVQTQAQQDVNESNRRKQSRANTPLSQRPLRLSRPPHPPDGSYEPNGSHNAKNNLRRGTRRRGVLPSSDDKLQDGEGEKIDRIKRSDSVDALVASSSSVSTSSDRKSAAGKASGRPPQGDSSSDKDLISLTGDLDKSARKAVASADDVTLALLITSWANSLSEARQHAQSPATQFESVFRASQALDIVANAVLQSFPSESPVRKALTSLFGFVLYGDHRLFVSVGEHVAKLNAALHTINETNDSYSEHRDLALSKTLNFLKNIYADVRAFMDVLPNPPEVRDRSPGSTNGFGLANGANAAVFAISSGYSDTPLGLNASPSGPDPTKAVERSMDAWRRAVARLQGEMVLISVLSKHMDNVEVELTSESNNFVKPIQEFYTTVQNSIRKHIDADIAARTNRLKAVYWADVVVGAETTVLQATRDHAEHWKRQFDAAQAEVERHLDEAGIGFGPSACVSENNFSTLLAASAAVAALLSCRQRAFSWAGDTAKLLVAMESAIHCLEIDVGGDLGPSPELKSKFFEGVDGAFVVIDEVFEWSSDSLHSKVLESMEKSMSKGNIEGESLLAQRPRALRFEEPPKTPVVEKDSGESEPSSVNRRKMRHVRMKSSPDALLHLNARMDDYSDGEAEVDRNVDREIEFTDDKDDDSGVKVMIEYIDGPQSSGEGLEIGLRSDFDTVTGETDRIPIVVEMNGTAGDDDDDEADDRDIIVHDDEKSDEPRKVHSHIRSMSVDGIPF